MLHFTSPYHRRLTWRYFALFVAIGLMGGLLGPALPHLAAMTNASMSQIAVLFTARALGNMAGALTTGVLIDRYSGHRVLLGMAMLGALGLLITPFSPSLALLTGMMGILGFAEVSLNAGGNTLLLWLHKESSGPQVSALHFCFGLGNMLTPLLIMLALAMTGQFQWAFWIVASCLLMVIVPIARSPSPGKPHADTTLGTHHLTKHRDPLLLGLLMLMFSLYVGIEITLPAGLPLTACCPAPLRAGRPVGHAFLVGPVGGPSAGDSPAALAFALARTGRLPTARHGNGAGTACPLGAAGARRVALRPGGISVFPHPVYAQQ